MLVTGSCHGLRNVPGTSSVVAKGLVRLEVVCCRHSGDPQFTPVKTGAGIQSLRRHDSVPRSARDWTLAFAGVTGDEQRHVAIAVMWSILGRGLVLKC
jgi:hypothetical protein